jgi:AcrR family transcriptional regulator
VSSPPSPSLDAAPHPTQADRPTVAPDGPAADDPAPEGGPRTVDEWTAGYLATGAAERRLVEAAGRCIARWGIRKTSLDDVAREAGVSRATVYRVFPGGKDRVVEAVFGHEIGRVLHEVRADLVAARTLEELLISGITATLRLTVHHEVVASVVRHEPELVLPHFAFHQLDRVLALADTLCRPHLSRFLPDAEVRPAAELLARVVLTFGFRRATWVDPDDPASIRRLVRTYLLPALTPQSDSPVQETS